MAVSAGMVALSRTLRSFLWAKRRTGEVATGMDALHTHTGEDVASCYKQRSVRVEK